MGSRRRPNPWEVFVEGRKQARSGEAVYGERFLVSFPEDIQDRIEELSAKWSVPRAEMVRYLVSAALDRTSVERMPVPADQETGGSE